jgi:hypothetical protein
MRWRGRFRSAVTNRQQVCCMSPAGERWRCLEIRLAFPRQRSKGTLKLPEEIGLEGIGGDDAADALRYLVATKSRSVVTMKLWGL